MVVGLLGCKYRKGVDGVHIRPYREGYHAAEVSDSVCMIRLDLVVRRFHLCLARRDQSLY